MHYTPGLLCIVYTFLGTGIYGLSGQSVVYAQTLRTCARDCLVTQVQILGPASEFESVQ